MAQLEPSPSPFTAADKLREVERELKMRRQVDPRPARYPGEAGCMTKSQQRQIAIMEAIRDDYIKVVASERLL